MSKYPSKYSPNKDVTAAQYFCELICENKAAFDKTTLPLKFWALPLWANFFKKNLRQVHKLIKQYGEKSVLRALSSPKFQGRYSIFTDFFIGLVEKENKKIVSESLTNVYTEINRNTVTSEPRTDTPRKSILDQLKDIENDIC